MGSLNIKHRHFKYCKTSNIIRTLVGNKIIDHSDVVGASAVGAAPITSSCSTYSSVGIWCSYIRGQAVLPRNHAIFHNYEPKATPTKSCDDKWIAIETRPSLSVRTFVWFTKWMMTSSNGKKIPRSRPFVRGIHRSAVNFPAQRTVTRSFDIFFGLCLNKWLSKHSQGWWLETSLRSLWRHSNAITKCVLRLLDNSVWLHQQHWHLTTITVKYLI